MNYKSTFLNEFCVPLQRFFHANSAIVWSLQLYYRSMILLLLGRVRLSSCKTTHENEKTILVLLYCTVLYYNIVSYRIISHYTKDNIILYCSVRLAHCDEIQPDIGSVDEHIINRWVCSITSESVCAVTCKGYFLFSTVVYDAINSSSAAVVKQQWARLSPIPTAFPILYCIRSTKQQKQGFIQSHSRKS